MNLTLVKKDGQHWVDSRQVAEMVDKNHADLCRDIRGYAEHLAKVNESKIALVDFFKESSYKDRKWEIRPCYLISLDILPTAKAGGFRLRCRKKSC